MHVSPSRQKAFPFGEGVGFADGRGYCLPPFGEVSALLTEEVVAFPFGEGVGFADGRGLCLSLWGRCRLCRQKRSVRWKVSPLGGVYLSFELNWEECRRRERLLLSEIQYGKEGLP